MTDTDQCYMYLMYVGNTYVQMSKVHSYDIFACCKLLSIELFHDCRATLFFVESKTDASTFNLTCSGL